MKKRILSLALTLALCLGLWLPASAAGGGSSQFLDSGSASMAKLSREEMAQLLTDNPLTMPDQVFDVQPGTSAPHSPGRVSDAALQAAVDRLNALRRIAGVPAVELDAALCENAQYGAVLLAASEFSHSPSQPADMEDSFYQAAKSATGSSNISAGSTLTGAVDSFMDDSDASNVDALGHRRWQLNPEMGKIGFGYVTVSSGYGRYVTEKVFDRSGAGCDYDFIGWPSSGNFPNNLSAFDRNTAWSVTLNPEKYRTPLNQGDVTVTLARESDGKTWTFQGSGYTASSSGAFFRTDRSNYGVSNCIIFRPDGVEMYEGVYTVTIDGLKSASGSPVDFSYQVDFFDPDNITAEPEPSEQPEQPQEAAFSDVPASAWYAPYVNAAAAAGLMNGTGGGKFSPMQTLSLAEVVTLTARLHAEGGGRSVPASAAGELWYQGAYDYCVDNGLFTAAEVPLSALTEAATRFQMVDLLDRSVPDSGKAPIHSSVTVPDLAESDPYGEVVYRWYRAGITEGDQTGSFHGNSIITRGETAAIFCRLAGLTKRV